jgi:hypothetical protein
MVDTKESYFNLTVEEQSDLLTDAARKLGVENAILEKDIWLCQVLETLFSIPEALPMTFKGGTSLSKVYRAIERFSEDIDITIDWQKLHHNPKSAEELKVLSKRKINQLSDEIKELLEVYVDNVLKPALQGALSLVAKNVRVEFETTEKDEEVRDKLRVIYPVATKATGYIAQSILIEFGARNAIEPGDRHYIVPDVANLFPNILFPAAHVHVLSPQRTFWEKATLIHDECNRPSDRARVNVHRMARHWYDLARLAPHDIGVKSIDNLELLNQVLEVKTCFYSYGFSRYDLCNTGGIKLVPGEEAINLLRRDYTAMVDAKMFYGQHLSFDDIIAQLSELEKQINQRCTQDVNPAK